MQPKLSIAGLFLLIALVIFIFGFFGDSAIKFFGDFEGGQNNFSRADFFIVAGTSQEVLSLQVSKGEIKQYELFKRGEVGDPTQLLPKEFIFIKND